MGQNQRYLLKFYIKLKRFKIDNRFFIYIFFCIVATVFWFLNALSKDYTYNFTYPIVFTDMPEDKLLVGKTTGDIKLKVSAYGFDLLQHNFKKSINPLEISLSSAYLHRRNQQDSSFYILSSQEKNKLSAQLKGIKIISISPDTLPLILSTIIKKKVAVVPDLNISYGQQYTLKNDIEIIPDSIFVFGPAIIIDTLQSLQTEKINIENVSKSMSFKTQLAEIENIKISDKEITLNVSVEKFTEVRFELRIDKLNVPDNVSLKTFPTKIKVKYHVGLSKNDRNDISKFRAVVDYEQIKMSAVPARMLKVVMINQADSIIKNSLRYYPSKVEYLIEK